MCFTEKPPTKYFLSTISASGDEYKINFDNNSEAYNNYENEKEVIEEKPWLVIKSTELAQNVYLFYNK